MWTAGKTDSLHYEIHILFISYYCCMFSDFLYRSAKYFFIQFAEGALSSIFSRNTLIITLNIHTQRLNLRVARNKVLFISRSKSCFMSKVTSHKKILSRYR